MTCQWEDFGRDHDGAGTTFPCIRRARNIVTVHDTHGDLTLELCDRHRETVLDTEPWAS